MAKFLNTTGISYHLEELIKNTQDRLYLISPYLQFHPRIKDHLYNLNLNKRDIRVVYRESKLKREENDWLENQVGIRTSVCPTLHSKCYLNENEAIVTSMNLYAFSQQNNDEMGIYVKKIDDPELYNDIFEETQRLLKISEEIRVSVKKVEKDADPPVPIVVDSNYVKTKHNNSKLMSITSLSKNIGLTSNELREIFIKKSWIEKNGKEYSLTKLGQSHGGQLKNGKFGEFIAWPEDVLSELELVK